MICDIQVVPSPTGTTSNEFKHVDAAIAVIAASGLKHTVHALGTTIEGPPDTVWDVARRAFDACLESGADKELMYLKLYQGERTVAELEASGQRCAAAAARPAAAARRPAAAAKPAAAVGSWPHTGDEMSEATKVPVGSSLTAWRICELLIHTTMPQWFTISAAHMWYVPSSPRSTEPPHEEMNPSASLDLSPEPSFVGARFNWPQCRPIHCGWHLHTPASVHAPL